MSYTYVCVEFYEIFNFIALISEIKYGFQLLHLRNNIKLFYIPYAAEISDKTRRHRSIDEYL